MDMNEYQKLAARTDNHNALAYYALGLTGEAGEVADLIKKYKWHGHDLDINQLIEELGDVLWYVAMLVDALCYDLDTVAAINIEKLRQRYPNGFEQERSRNRKEKT